MQPAKHMEVSVERLPAADGVLARRIFVVRPARFGYNPETEASNRFQRTPEASPAETSARAVQEFDAFVEVLRAHGVDVACLSDTLHPSTPDSIFPNNWVSIHPGGRVVLYPMMAPSRRQETRKGFLRGLVDGFGLDIATLLDLRYYAEDGKFLEGTGSMVLDHIRRDAYVCLSERSYEEPLEEVSHFLGYEPVTFRAYDADDYPIYHTNVLMSIGEDYAVVCEEAIDAGDRTRVMERLRASRPLVISIDREQMMAFAGNILQVRNREGRKLLLMSESACRAFTPAQREALGAESSLVSIPIPTIEGAGGGSIRCMIAEWF